MAAKYQTAFDLIAHPDRIQAPFEFYAIFFAAGIGLLVLAAISIKRRWQRKTALSIFALVWVAFCAAMTFIDARDVTAVRSAVETGKIFYREGCLAYFRPGEPWGSKTTIGNEEWSLGGTIFNYGAGEARPGYHIVESKGGVVHPDTKVRVYFVTSQAYGRNEIVRIDVANHGCPPARRVEQSTDP